MSGQIAQGAVNSYLSNVLNSKASQGGNLVRAGKYLFEIKRIWIEAGRKSDFFKVDLIVRKCEGVGKVYGGIDPNTKVAFDVETTPNALGTTASVVIDLRNDSGPGNVKSFGLALAGLDEKTAPAAMMASGGEFEKFLQQMVNEDPNNGMQVQPLRGLLIEDETFTRAIKKGENKDKPFTGHNWKHVPRSGGNSPEEVKARAQAQATAS